MIFSRYHGGRSIDAVASTVRRLAAGGMRSCVSLLPGPRFRPRGVDREAARVLSILPALGTHDEGVVAEAERQLALYPRPEFEFQFFLGAKPALAEKLIREGRSVRIYVPYGRLLRYFIHTLPQMDVSRNLQRVLRRPVIR